MKKIIFRVDSGDHIGVGHVMRCLTLAHALKKKFDITFICKDHKGQAGNLIQKDFKLELLSGGVQRHLNPTEADNYVLWIGEPLEQDLKATNDFIKSHGCDFFIVDHYSIDSAYEEKIKAPQIMAIDDLSNRNHFCDILLDQNITAKKENYLPLLKKEAKLLMGTQYALLREEFEILRQRVSPETFNRPTHKIVVFFGGADAEGLTLKMAKGLEDILKQYEFHFILSEKHSDSVELKSLLSPHKNCYLHSLVSNFAEMMLSADLFIGAGGTTSWERASLGVASAIVAMADNQLGNCLELKRTKNSFYLGKARELDSAAWKSFFTKIVPDQPLWYRYRKNSFSLVNARGTKRVVEEIEKVLC